MRADDVKRLAANVDQLLLDGKCPFVQDTHRGGLQTLPYRASISGLWTNR